MAARLALGKVGMPPVVVAASANNFNFGVCDFGPAPPVATPVNPTFPGNCVVACAGSIAIAGDFSGTQVQLFDLANPAAPVALGGAVLTGFGGIGAVAIRGTLAAAGERNGFRVALIDISNPSAPSVVRTTTTGLGGFSSLAFVGTRVVVGGGANGPPTGVRVDFNPATPTVSALTPGFIGGMAVDADAGFGRIVAGNMNGSQVALMDASGAVLTTVNVGFLGVTSVAISGLLAVAAGANSFTFERINFGVSPPARSTINPGYGSGSVVALSGTTCACGAIVGGGTTPVKLVNLAPATPAVGQGVNPGVASIASLAFGILVGTPPSPVVALMPSDLAFGTVRVGQTKQETLTIRNMGTAALNVSNIQTSSARFTFSPSPPLTIQPNQQVAVAVTFAPNAEQSLTATLTITTNDPVAGTVTVPLTGTGSLPHIAVSPASLSFGNVAVCLQGTGQVTVQNTGGVDLSVTSIATSAPFSVTPASAVIPPGGTRALALGFAPVATGAASGTLLITSDDPANPTRTVALSGNGTPTPPPGLTLSPTALAFGAVPRQNFAGMRLTIGNSGPCQALSVTLSTSGPPFFVTDVDPTSVPTITQPVSASVNPGAPKRFAVVFAPTVPGAAAGTLTITSNDPAQPALTVALAGSGVDPSPGALELVLDRSGSMLAPVAGGTKMDALKRAVNMFADVVLPGQGDAMGVVEFDDQFAVLTTAGAFDAAKQATVKADVASLSPRGMTSIGGGLQLGQSELTGASHSRKVILVMTDGMENTPPTIAAVQPAIVSAGIETYAVGFGQPQTISAQALSQLAASSNGKFFVSDDPLILRKNFAQILADAFRQNVAADPILAVSSGQAVELPVWITDCERRITFVANWDDPNVQIGLEIVGPDGTVFSPGASSSNQLVRYAQHPGYCFYQIAFAPLDGSADYIGPQRSGEWTMRLSGASLPAGRARCTTMVLVESDLMLQTRLRGTDTQQPLTLTVSLSDAGAGISGADVSAVVTAPRKSVSQVVGRAALERFVAAPVIDDVVGVSVFERAVRNLSLRRQALVPTTRKKHRLKGRRGIYTLRLAPPLVEGVYQFEIEVSGYACGGRFQRYSSQAFAVARKLDPASTTITITAPTTTVAVATITPMDAQGVRLGPGLAPTIAADVRGGRVTAIIDNLDGTYAIHTAWPRGIRSSRMSLELAGTHVELPFSPAATGRRRKA